jgi:hypothetical protein
MDIHVLDPQWLADHDTQVCAWSPFTVLWSIHHDLIINARTPLGLYRSIAPNGGFTNDVQRQIITEIIQLCSPVAAFVDRFIQIYTSHNMSSRAHYDRPPDAVADEAARTLIQEFQGLLNERLTALAPLSETLAHGDYGFTSDLQQFLLTSAARHIEHLTSMQALLRRWTQAQQTPNL